MDRSWSINDVEKALIVQRAYDVAEQKAIEEAKKKGNR